MGSTASKISPELSAKLKVTNVILTVLIVLMHLNATYCIPDEYMAFTHIAVPTFFAISSFLYFISYDFGNNLVSYKAKLKSRLWTLVLPFFLYSLIGLIFGLLRYKFSNLEELPFGELTWANIPEKLYFGYFNGPLWYLRALFEFVLIAPLFGLIIKQTRYSILLLIPLYFFGRQFNYYLMPHWCFVLFTGGYLAIYFDEIKKAYHRYGNLKWVGAIVGTILLSVLLITRDYYSIFSLSPMALLLILSSLPIHRLRGLLLIAPYSFLIFCLHIPVSRLGIGITDIFGINSAPISLILSTALTILIITTLGILLRRNPRLFSLLNGARQIGTITLKTVTE